MKKKIGAGFAALASAGVLLAPAVASAVPTAWSGATEYMGTGDTSTGTVWEWDLDSSGGIGHSYYYVDGDYLNNVVCGYAGQLLVDGSEISNTDLLSDTDSNGDFVVTGTGTFGSLDATVEYRLYAEGDLYRTVYKLTNNTASPITYVPSSNNEGDMDNVPDYGTGASSSSSGDQAFDTGDWWYALYQSDSPSLVYSRFLGSPGKFTISDLDGAEPRTASSGDVALSSHTLAPGESFQWIFFHHYQEYDWSGDAAADEAAAAAVFAVAAEEFGTGLLTGRLARGLDTTLASNWAFSESLPTTGANTMGLALSALALSLMGAAVLVRRRQTA